MVLSMFLAEVLSMFLAWFLDVLSMVLRGF
jgi:hypothetical protein